MKYYATIDKQGSITGFYTEQIHGALEVNDPNFPLKEDQTRIDAPLIKNSKTKIPNGAIEISEKLWQKHLQGTKQIYKNKKWVEFIESPAKLLTDAKALKKGILTNKYNELKSADISFQGNKFQISTAFYEAGAVSSVPIGFFWLDVNNIQVPMDYTTFKALHLAVFSRTQTLFVILQNKKESVNNATTLKQVDAVSWQSMKSTKSD